MRGSPLLRAAIAFLVILSLGWPLWRMTRSAEPASSHFATPAPTGPKTIHLQLSFTLVPSAVSVSYLGKEIWNQAAPGAEVEKDLTISYPAEGVDLGFHVAWPEDAPQAAMRVRLTDPDGNEHEKSLWSKGPADEVLTFP